MGLPTFDTMVNWTGRLRLSIRRRRSVQERIMLHSEPLQVLSMTPRHWGTEVPELSSARGSFRKTAQAIFPRSGVVAKQALSIRMFAETIFS